MAGRTPRWKERAARLGRGAGLGEEVLELLDAFGPAGEVAACELAGEGGAAAVSAARDVEAALVGELDGPQAAIFARRIAAVDVALGASPADRLLHALLHGRLEQILSGPGPRGLRVRALADFVYSQHARLALGGHGPTPQALVAGPDWRQVAPGVEAASIAGHTTLGPQRLHLLRLDHAAVRLRCIDRRAQADAGEDLAAHSLRLGAIAALSGGFFLYSEPDIRPPSARRDPVGLLVDEGRVCSPPLFPRSALLDDGERWRIAAPGPRSVQLFIDGVGVQPIDLSTRAQVTRAGAGEHGSVAIVGDSIVAVAGPGGWLDVPLNGVVVGLASVVGLRSGQRVEWRLPGVRAAMAGGPRLVEDGLPIVDLAAAPLPSPQLVLEHFCGTAPPRTFSQDETGDRNLLPRLAVGLDAQGRLLALAVDGRDLGGALGLTLRATARVMAALGCVSAMNLDGGSSKRMVVAGRVVDQPSTEIHGGQADPAHRRPVNTAILVLARS